MRVLMLKQKMMVAVVLSLTADAQSSRLGRATRQTSGATFPKP